MTETQTEKVDLGFPTTSDPVVQTLFAQIEKNYQEVVEANKVLLADSEEGTGLREIDKALKEIAEKGHEDKELKQLVDKWAKARDAAKNALDKARNSYRVAVLHEDEKPETPEVDSDAIKTKRGLLVNLVKVAKDYATDNNLPDVEAWAAKVSIPQVGRQGSSSVGQKKPRARVTVNDKTFESFGEAAKALSTLLSTDDNKVEVTSNDLVSAWDAAGSEDGGSFNFREQTVKVTRKQTQAQQNAA